MSDIGLAFGLDETPQQWKTLALLYTAKHTCLQPLLGLAVTPRWYCELNAIHHKTALGEQLRVAAQQSCEHIFLVCLEVLKIASGEEVTYGFHIERPLNPAGVEAFLYLAHVESQHPQAVR